MANHLAGPPAITAYLDFLAQERNVAPATQKQALNALAFLTKQVFGIEEFTLDHLTPAPKHPPLAPKHPPLAPKHPPLAPKHPPLAPKHPPLAAKS